MLGDDVRHQIDGILGARPRPDVPMRSIGRNPNLRSAMDMAKSRLEWEMAMESAEGVSLRKKLQAIEV